MRLFDPAPGRSEPIATGPARFLDALRLLAGDVLRDGHLGRGHEFDTRARDVVS